MTVWIANVRLSMEKSNTPKVNNGKDYEVFVQQVYKFLYAAENLTDIDIQQNVILQGNSRKRQIDVYWEFTQAGVRYQTAVECKDYATPVEAEKIEAFATALHDLGNIRGIFASREGFQKGAIAVARQYGIQLMEIRRPEDKDWDGRIKTIVLLIDLMTLHGDPEVSVEVDKAWVDQNHIKLSMGRNIFNGQKTFVEYQGTQKSIERYVNMVPRDKEGDNLLHVFDLPGAWLINEDGSKVKINRLAVTYGVRHYHEKTVIDGSQVVQAVVKNVISGQSQVIKINGDVVSVMD